MTAGVPPQDRYFPRIRGKIVVEPQTYTQRFVPQIEPVFNPRMDGNIPCEPLEHYKQLPTANPFVCSPVPNVVPMNKSKVQILLMFKCYPKHFKLVFKPHEIDNWKLKFILHADSWDSIKEQCLQIVTNIQIIKLPNIPDSAPIPMFDAENQLYQFIDLCKKPTNVFKEHVCYWKPKRKVLEQLVFIEQINDGATLQIEENKSI